MTRWFYSTNHKDIGTMYLLFAMMAGIVGGFLSVMMRLELQEPGLQYFANQHMLQRVRDRPRTDHGVLHGHAGHDRRLRQLVRAAQIGAPDMAFPRMNNISFWLLPVAFICC